MKKTKKFTLKTTHIIMLSFLGAILAGSLLLILPISSATGESVSYVDALFTATTSTCVTGLTVQTTADAWSLFGQIVILFLIQIGGLGVITIMAAFMIAFHKKIGIKDSLLIQDAFNLSSFSGLVKFVKKVLIGTLLVETAGAILYMFVFIPEFGAKGIWYSIFTSVSAFCNAGIDIIGDSSLCSYVDNPLINFTTCSLIVLGGIGYPVWWDVIRVFKKFKNHGFKCLKQLTLHSKIVLLATACLIFIGAAGIFAFEYANPLTLGNLNLYDKIQAAFFQSVTCRTAGFATISQEGLTNAGAILSVILMFIGGSPVGTAGGIKSVTFVTLFAITYSTIVGKDRVTMFNRQLPEGLAKKAVAVTCMAFAIVFSSIIALAAVTPSGVATGLDITYESVSAMATVGLSRNLTPLLNTASKLILIATMYFGRIGPITLGVAFGTRKENENHITDPVEQIIVG